jgi:hypothetical protein
LRLQDYFTIIRAFFQAFKLRKVEGIPPLSARPFSSFARWTTAFLALSRQKTRDTEQTQKSGAWNPYAALPSYVFTLL